jgi:tetratricopeptide (TPR) repeat protein
MDDRVARLIEQGQAAAQRGNSELARNYLQAAVDLEPNNATAWLWFAGVLEDLEDQKYALEQVLTLDPDNERAEGGLRYVNELLAQQPQREPSISFDKEPPMMASESDSLSIDQQLRASLREEEPPEDIAEPTPQDFRSGLISESNVALTDDSPSEGGFFAPGDDLNYRIAVAVLAILFVVGLLCFPLILLDLLPF